MISIIVPWVDRGGERRSRVAAYVLGFYRRLVLGEVVVGTYPDDGGPLNRSRLRNEGARKASGDILIFSDADSIVPRRQLMAAVDAARQAPGVVLPYDRAVTNVSSDNVDLILDGADPWQFVEPHRPSYRREPLPDEWHAGPAYVMRRDTFTAVNGFDEGFVGWGDEEMAFLLRTALDVAPLRFVDGGVLHLMPLTNSGHQPPVLTPGTEEHAMYQANVARRKKMADERRPVRIAVYAPAKNEEHNVAAWAESAKDADAVVLVDTGSTDSTVAIAASIPGVTVHQIAVDPWRFDVGRNACLALLPADADIAVPLDLDERLQPGWRESLEAAWRLGGRQFTFDYQWAPEVSFRYDRIHARHGYQWRGAAHEYPSGPGPKVDTDVRIVHERDQGKDRSQYLTLLEMGWREDPNPRNTYYLAREYFYENDWTRARDLFTRYLAMPEAVYDQERSEACRHMARMVYEQHQESWLLRACYEAPQRRECWADLAVWYRDHGQPQVAAGVAARVLSITEQTTDNSFRVEAWAWDDAAFRQMLTL